jgi:hypothetical protein
VARARLEVADIVRTHEQELLVRHVVSPAKRRVLADIRRCRTAALGGHVDVCNDCGHREVSYNSCRNRHCPKCQGGNRAAWVEAREADLLPVEYFHVVFTLPPEIAALALQNKRVVYGLLFRSVASTLKEIALDRLGAEIGFIAVLHTWGQTLQHHPHLHCVIPGGGLSLDGQRWVPCPPGFFLPVKVLSTVFRAKMLQAIHQAFERGELRFQGQLHRAGESGVAFRSHLARAKSKDWVVYAKPPFGGPAQVLRYIARYTHRVAISNARLVDHRDGQVSFRWKDYARGDRLRTMTLAAVEFLRRFLLHVLPKGFPKIRHYGLLANRSNKLDRCRELLRVEAMSDGAAIDVHSKVDDHDSACPSCGSHRVRRRLLSAVRETIPPRLDSS